MKPSTCRCISSPAAVTRLTLASGTGSNFEAIADAVASGSIPAAISLVVCNRPGAAVIAKAEARGIPVRLIEHRAYASRELFETEVADRLQRRGYSTGRIEKILGRNFLSYAQRIWGA